MSTSPVAAPDASDPAPRPALPEPDPALGLSADEVRSRRDQVGPNRLDEPPGRPRWRRFVDQLRSVLVLVLAGAAGVAALLGDLKDAVVVSVVLLVNAVLGYVQEGRAEGAMDALERMLVAHAKVRRDGRVTEVDADELVPGDVVLLESGDRIPADGRFLSATSFAVDEASFTGESVPVDKTAPKGGAVDAEDRAHLGFMNTTVARGRGEMVVTASGMSTEIGQLASLMHEAEPEATPLQRQLDRLGRRLALLAGGAVSVVFATRLAQGDPLSEALIGAVALAVAAIPEGLPAVVTVTLAVGVHQMAIRKAIVKRLASVETLGSTTVICSDKTGTLTKNEMVARQVVLGHGSVDVDPDATGGATGEPDDPVLRGALEHATLCSDATFTDGRLVGDPTEGALVALAAAGGIDPEGLRSDHPRVAEVPFDSATKLMATFHHEDDHLLCVVKGAPDVVLDRTAAQTGRHGAEPLDGDDRQRWLDRNEALARGGMRVLAVAARRIPLAEALDEDGEVADPDRWVADLELEALVGIVDPPRPEARNAIELCRQAGVAVKMITGDHGSTAAAIAEELGIQGRVVTGAELDAMDDEALEAQIEDIGVCARVSPEHKVRVVRALKARGHVVAMTGDGVNDAPALRHADIGVAMGITGTEVTREAADMVLADDDFATIVAAVERGRAIYDNIVKFVRFQLTTNMGAIGTLLLASVLAMPAPLSAVQVLFVNIIADGPPAMTLGIDPPGAGAMQQPPRTPESPILDRRRLLSLLPPAATMVAGTLLVFAYADDRWGEAVGMTMAFTTFVLFQLANVFNARTEQRSVLSRESLRNRKLWIAVGSVAAAQVAIVSLGSLQSIFTTVALDASQWALCVATALTVVLVEELRKLVLRHRPRHA